MNQGDLNFNSAPEPQGETPSQGASLSLAVFKFDPRPVAKYVALKWRWIAVFFFASLIIFWALLRYKSNTSQYAWQAEAKIFHQARSDRVPSFYKPVDTQTVLQFISSQDVFNRVASRLSNSEYPFEKSMLNNVEVSLGKNKLNIISVTASASNPDTAAAIANAVADEGISEYIRRQNYSVRLMIDERLKQKSEIERDLAAIQDEKQKYASPASGMMPDIELQKLQDDIFATILMRNEFEMRLKNTEIKIEQTHVLLNNTPKSVEFEKIVDNTSSLGVRGKIAELERLRMRYTDDNPKIRVLIGEIELLKKDAEDPANQTPARVTYRKNEAYGALEEILGNLEIEQSSIRAGIVQYNVEIEKRREQIAKVMEKNKGYSELLRREKDLNDKMSKLSQNIADLDFLIGSAVPDVSMFQKATPPTVSMLEQTRLRVLALGFFATAFFVAAIAAFKIAKLKLMSSAEFSLAFAMDDIGESPLRAQFGDEIKITAVQKIWRNLRNFSDNSKRYAIFKFFPDEELNKDIVEVTNLSAINGLKTFRLKCVPMDKKSESSEKISPEDDKLAAQLISIVKFADSGVFYFRNNYCMDLAEIDLLKFDIATISKEYDVIVIEVDCDEYSGMLCSQIAILASYAVISAPFDKVGKVAVMKNLSQIKEVTQIKLGGILTNVPKPYYKP